MLSPNPKGVPIRDQDSGNIESLEQVVVLLRQSNGILAECDAAEVMKLSESRFRHLFKELTGITYREACLRLKLEQGLTLLQSTTLPIMQISSLLHYSNRSKFEIAFKRH